MTPDYDLEPTVLYLGSSESAPTAAESLTNRLKRYAVFESSDTADTLSRVETGAIDCLVTEYELPSENGTTLTAAVRDLDSQLPVILFANRQPAAVIETALSAGITDYIEKETPRPYQLLANRIRHAIEPPVGTETDVDSTRLTQTNLTTALTEQLSAVTDEQALGHTLIEAVGKTTGCTSTVYFCDPAANEETRWRIITESGTVDSEALSALPDAVRAAFRSGEPQQRSVQTAPINGPAENPLPFGSDDTVMVAVPLGECGVLTVTATSVRQVDKNILSEVAALGGAVCSQYRRYSRLETRLQVAAGRNRQLSQFVHSVSHDLNSPLSVLYGRIELAHEEPESASLHLQAARNAVERIESLVSDHLQTVRGNENIAERDAVSLHTAATQAWRIIDPSTARLRIEPHLETVVANPTKLQQLFENLIRNAIEHGADDPAETKQRQTQPSRAVGLRTERPAEPSPTPTVTVTVRPTPDGFAICDDGPGIPVANRDHVFQSGYTTEESGSGLGLAIVKQIVDAHGWSISVGESRCGGARFEIKTS